MQDPMMFALTVLAILGTPGPTNTLLATAGASVGVRRALLLIPGEGAGYLISILVLGLVLGPIVASSPIVSLSLRLLVGAYLLLLAWRLWRRHGAIVEKPATIVTVGQVFITTLLNPKAIIFALGVIPFAAPRPWLYLLSFLGLTATVATAWICIGATMGRVAAATGQSRIIPRVGAAAVGMFAVLLIVSPLLR